MRLRVCVVQGIRDVRGKGFAVGSVRGSLNQKSVRFGMCG